MLELFDCGGASVVGHNRFNVMFQGLHYVCQIVVKGVYDYDGSYNHEETMLDAELIIATRLKRVLQD